MLRKQQTGMVSYSYTQSCQQFMSPEKVKNLEHHENDITFYGDSENTIQNKPFPNNNAKEKTKDNKIVPEQCQEEVSFSRRGGGKRKSFSLDVSVKVVKKIQCTMNHPNSLPSQLKLNTHPVL